MSRKKEFSAVFSLIALALSTGCSSIIDKSVAQSSSSFWVPPQKEITAKSKRIEKLSTIGHSLNIFVEEFDLSALLDIAFENNPATKKSWQAARIAAAQSGKASSVFFPKIVISGNANRTRTSSPASKNTATVFYPAIEMQCSIFKFGGHAKSMEAARQLLYSANYQHNRALQTLAHEVQKCYFLLDSAEGAVEASQKNFNDAAVTYDVAFVKFQSGLSNIQDYLQAKANKSRAEFELENTKSHVESARANLANAIGVTVSSRIRIARSGDDNDVKDFDVNIDCLISETLKIRQDILAKHSAVQARQAAVWASTAKNLPELVIGGSGNRKKYHHHNGRFDNFNIYASLQWTIFDGFNNIYDVIESRATWKLAQQELRQAELAVSSEIWAKYHSFKSAVKQLNAGRNYEQAAKESFDSMMISYKNGLSSFNELMSSQTQLAVARQQTVVSKNALSLAIVDLAYAAGI